MTGAAGATRIALAETLWGATQELDTAEEKFAIHIKQLVAQADDAQAVVRLATSLWANLDFRLAPSFAARAQHLYEAQATSLDFRAPMASQTINNWVSKHTGGLVSHIMSPQQLASHPDNTLVLINAIYFEGRWSYPFDASLTKQGTFRLASGGMKEASFMQQTNQSFGYLSGDGWQAISMPYDGYPQRFAMHIFVPNEPTGLPHFMASITESEWTKWQASLRYPTEGLEVDFILPRFKIEWESELVPLFTRLGLTKPFTLGVDFEPLGLSAEHGGGCIESVIHKAYLKVDEEGTEAAAVTAMMWMAGGGARPVPHKVFVKADVPFFCAVVESESGTMLFAGVVNNPE